MSKLESSRLLLRNLQLTDLEDFHAYRSQAEICRYQGFKPMDEDKARAFIEEMSNAPFRAPGQWCQLGIWSKAREKLVGDCAITFLAYEPRLVEMGCTLNAAYQGQGFAQEAMHLLCKHVFEEHGVHKIKATIDPRNSTAIKLLERLGFSKEGHLKLNYFDEYDQAWVDEVIYGKLA